jgi:hypothetical protein
MGVCSSRKEVIHDSGVVFENMMIGVSESDEEFKMDDCPRAQEPVERAVILNDGGKLGEIPLSLLKNILGFLTDFCLLGKTSLICKYLKDVSSSSVSEFIFKYNHTTLDARLENLSKIMWKMNLRTIVIRSNQFLTDEGLMYMSRLTGIRNIDLTDCQNVSSAGLDCLSMLPCLESLNLDSCKGVSDEGLAKLSGMRSLKYLNISECNVTDKGMEYLAMLPNLQHLNLFRCRNITYSGLEHLSMLPKLKCIVLNYNDYVLIKGVEELKRQGKMQNVRISQC